MRRSPRGAPARTPGRHPDALGDAWERAFSADQQVLIDVLTDPDVPLLPPFPAGEAKLAKMREGLEKEGEAGSQALRLLDTYADQERRLASPGS